MNAHMTELLDVIERDPAASLRAIEECSRQFSAVRHIETIWLYPMLAQVVAGDASARSQLAELRLIGLMLARRMQRCFDELVQAVRAEVFVTDAAARAADALARYSSHSDRALYPLYELIGPQREDSAQVA
jgi:hypothetical protein